MSGGGLDELTTAQKRALLAEHLRKRSLAPSPAIADDAAPAPARERRGAPRAERGPQVLDDEVIELASLRDWSAQEQHPYIRYVAPYKGFLYQRLGLDKTFVRGEGCHLIDADGTRHADFIAQFGAVPFGHHPEAIWRALEAAWREELPNLVITSISNTQANWPRACSRWRRRASPMSYSPTAARRRSRPRSSSRAPHRPQRHPVGVQRLPRPHARGHVGDRYRILPARFRRSGPGFSTVPFGDSRGAAGGAAARPDFFAAFLVEPIQGESGIQVAPPGYLAAARELCHAHGALLIVDEVQTGPGGLAAHSPARKGSRRISCARQGARGGLIPIGACLYSERAYSEQFDLRHGSTFAGNTLACRAALAALDELTKDDVDCATRGDDR